MYPTYCTNPTVQAPKTLSNSLTNQTATEFIEHIEYPSLDDILLKEEVLLGKNHRKWNTSTASTTSIQSTTKESALNFHNFNGSEIGDQQQNSSMQMKLAPIIDRGSKVAALKTYNETHKPIDELAKDQEVFMQKAKENDRRLEIIAKQWENIRNKEQLSNDDENFISNMIQWDSESIDNVSISKKSPIYSNKNYNQSTLDLINKYLRLFDII